nr:M12 family metallopeptidase [Pedobacter sp. ASV19]
MKTLLKLSLFLLFSLATLNSCKRDSNDIPSEVTSTKGVTFHKLMINGNETIIKEAEGKYYFSEDEILSERQFNILKRMANSNLSTVERSTIITDFTKKWTNNVWVYKIQSNRTSEILTAMSWISAVANIYFVPRTNETNYVTFYDTNESASWSNAIGMENGTKEIKISTSQSTGSIAHEIMHSLGFFHEQCRPDRDNYVIVHMDQIPNNDLKSQYNISPFSQSVGPFDFDSIMLYASNPYMTKIDGTGWPTQRDHLSEGDKQGLATLYGAKISGPDQICSEGIFSTGSGIITISNASGVASLTSLGNNQWKVTRIGNANGRITLNSTSSYKQVAVGSYNNIINNGGNTIPGGINSGLSAEISDPSATYAWVVYGGVIVSGQGTPNVIVKPDRNNFNGVSNNFGVILTFSNSCGTSTIDKVFLVPPTGGGDIPDPGDGEIL